MSSIASVSQENFFKITAQNLFPIEGFTLVKFGIGSLLGFFAHMGFVHKREQTLEERAIIAENRNSLALKIGVVVFSALFLVSLFVNYPLEMALPVFFAAVVLIPHEISRYFYPKVSNSSD